MCVWCCVLRLVHDQVGRPVSGTNKELLGGPKYYAYELCEAGELDMQGIFLLLDDLPDIGLLSDW